MLAEVHLSWNASDIKAIFYVNDTMTATRAPLPDARVGEEAKRYLARGVRAELMERSLAAAQAAYGNALLAQKMMLNRTGGLMLPVVQMKMTNECFDGRPLAHRLRGAQQAGDGRGALPRVFDAPLWGESPRYSAATRRPESLSDGYAGETATSHTQHEQGEQTQKKKKKHARVETEAERRERESWGL